MVLKEFQNKKGKVEMQFVFTLLTKFKVVLRQPNKTNLVF